MVDDDRKHATRNVSFRLKKYTQMKKSTQDPQSSAPEKINMELGESREAMIGNEEREGRMETCGGEDGQRSVVEAAGGYSRDRPPVDDCCPICFDDFHIPCRTSCGHWFCGNCILQIWKYMANFKQCACPICGSLIINVVPHSSVLIQPGQEVSKVLEEIKKYNSQNMVGWYGIFRKFVAMPFVSWRRLTAILNLVHCIVILLQVVYDAYNFQFLPYGLHGILLLILMCKLAVITYVMWRIIWRTILDIWLNRME